VLREGNEEKIAFDLFEINVKERPDSYLAGEPSEFHLIFRGLILLKKV
jgi:hypothetical protein